MSSPEHKTREGGFTEREATDLLRKVGIKDAPVNPLEIASALGVTVRFVEFSGDSKGVAGLYNPAKSEILINREDPGFRQTFTIAHELGHKVLHEDWSESEDYKVFWRHPSRQNSNDPREREANSFAANLLMPRKMVDKYQNLGIEDIARIFAVSEQVAKFQLRNLYGV